MLKSVNDNSDFRSRGILHATPLHLALALAPTLFFSDSFAIHANLRRGGFRRPGAGDESCVSDANCSTGRKLVAYVTEVPVEKNAPTMPGNSLSSVVVTHGT